ncbi:hypothetical protein EYF80_020648 [Liparis tanakae]|uniref:Uncharacterized protein n=1 Tax=Liparis tanakae TaxID=230148 RepID=A0A4Z2HUF9_9TELE|nr:hypothetical protein EYF80_020648 [Liparis tanakae]
MALWCMKHSIMPAKDLASAMEFVDTSQVKLQAVGENNNLNHFLGSVILGKRQIPSADVMVLLWIFHIIFLQRHKAIRISNGNSIKANACGYGYQSI